MSVDGTVESGFEPVAEAFEANFGDGSDVAAQCCVHIRGERVVDLARGHDHDALQVVFSVTKGATAACANLLVQRGVLDLDAPVTDYWPEYGVNGKGATTVRHVLAHKAGVLAPDPGLTMDDLADWDRISSALASRAPAWRPGTAYGYHAFSFGWLVGELVRRVDGRGLGRFFAEELAQPAGADFWIGLPESEEERVAPLRSHGGIVPSELDPTRRDTSVFVGPFVREANTLNGLLPDDLVELASDRRFRSAEVGAAGGLASARGIARLYAWLIEELTPDTIAGILTPETQGPDRVVSSPALAVEQRFSRGFSVPAPDQWPTRSRTFGHPGAGGSIGFADPGPKVAFGYATTRLNLGPRGTDPRAECLISALYDSLTRWRTRRPG